MGFFDSIDDNEEFNPDFVLINQTGYAIHEVYVSESDNGNWEEDILGEGILEDGASLNVNFTTNSTNPLWDIRTVDEEGDEEIYVGFDLSEVHQITVFYNEDGEAQAEYE